MGEGDRERTEIGHLRLEIRGLGLRAVQIEESNIFVVGIEILLVMDALKREIKRNLSLE